MAGYLTYEERKTVEEMHKGGYTPKEIAERFAVNLATIYRELHRGYTGERDNVRRPVYSAKQAQDAFKMSLSLRGRNNPHSRKAV
jgi:IS30 family transposase